MLTASRWPAVNVPIWTLKYEILCYLALLVSYRLIGPRPRARRWCLAAAALLLTAAFVVQRAFPSLTPSGSDTLASFSAVHIVRFFMVFFAAAAYAAAAPVATSHRAAIPAVMLAGIVLIPFAELRFALTTLLVAWSAIEIGRSRWLFFPAHHRLGDLSYGTYLYAFPIQMLTLTRWLDGTNFWWLTSIDIALALGCAALSWHFVERPFLQLKPKRSRAPSSGSASLRCSGVSPKDGSPVRPSA